MISLPQIASFLRTPESCFEGLADFPYLPHYAQIGGLRVAFIDEGPRDGPLVLLLHGEPAWSYLYRKMIPVLVQAGCRVIAPDLVGRHFASNCDNCITATHDCCSHVIHADWHGTQESPRIGLGIVLLDACFIRTIIIAHTADGE